MLLGVPISVFFFSQIRLKEGKTNGRETNGEGLENGYKRSLEFYDEGLGI
jgi:hypothetical protein